MPLKIAGVGTFYTSIEAARFFGVSVRQIQKLVKEGKLQAIEDRQGVIKKLWIPETSIVRYYESTGQRVWGMNDQKKLERG